MAQGPREGRKLFVGSLPDGIADETLIATFQQYGHIDDVFVKPGCEPGRQCAFVTFATPQQAQYAKESCDRVLTFPGAAKACEVMVARNQGLFGQQGPQEIAPAFAPAGPVQRAGPAHAAHAAQVAGDAGPRKIHVGSLPDSISEWQLKQEFSRFGVVTDVMVKTGCEPGRQWGFVTFQRSVDAHVAKESTDRMLMFPGSDKPCEVVMARNQGMFGQQGATPEEHSASQLAVMSRPAMVQAAASPMTDGPRKILVGSLPDGVSQDVVRAVFEEYGTIVDIYVKPNCEVGRQWAFVTFATHQEAQNAKLATDRILTLPGRNQACEVLFARSEGGNQAASSAPSSSTPASMAPSSAGANSSKIFVGSMPGHITERDLRAEFSRFGHILDAYAKPDCEPGRQWGFVTFAQPQEASLAKECTDRLLSFPGADKPCEVMLARNRAPGGQEAARADNGGGRPTAEQQPPPPPAETFDVSATTWRVYYTKEGTPYFYNTATHVTQWHRPDDLPPQSRPAAPSRRPRYSPY